MTVAPEFLVIGAARAGTTALYTFLRQHPQIFMPRVKEPNFFAFADEHLDCRGPGADFIINSVTSADAYRALFAAAPEGTIRGEASPLYLFAPAAPGNIRRLAPQAKMIAILRNPVEQAWSHFMYATKLRIEDESDFVRALALEEGRLAAGWQPLFGYSRFPRYGEQLSRYFALFPRDQFLIRTYEDYQADPGHLLSEIFAFIGADPAFRPDTGAVVNAGGVPKSRIFQDFLMKSNPLTRAVGLIVPQPARLRIRDWLAGFNMRREETMPPAARRILLERLSDDIRLAGRLIGRDLSAWLR